MWLWGSTVVMSRRRARRPPLTNVPPAIKHSLHSASVASHFRKPWESAPLPPSKELSVFCGFSPWKIVVVALKETTVAETRCSETSHKETKGWDRETDRETHPHTQRNVDQSHCLGINGQTPRLTGRSKNRLRKDGPYRFVLANKQALPEYVTDFNSIS